METKGRRAAFCTLGCKLNFAETSAIARSLGEAGYEITSFDGPADLYVVNTCSVTGAGEKSSRNALRRALRTNPEAVVVAVGCYAQLRPAELAAIRGVDLVLGNDEKFALPSILERCGRKGAPGVLVSPLSGLTAFHGALSGGGRTRCFLKVQDGCDYCCHYCTVPLARGSSRSAAIADLLREAEAAVARGFREVVLTGVNIGDFGRPRGEKLVRLLESLASLPGLERLRIGSVEPDLLSDDILRLAASSPVIMPHFHLPLQSGSDEVLKMMGRRYTTALFASRIESIHRWLPHAFTGVDLIAGTHGETPGHFEASCRFVNNLGVSQLHAFPYSERAGTRTPLLPGRVEPEERKRRARRYINLSEKLHRAFCESHLGTLRPVLFESVTGDNQLTGLTDNYLRVELPFRPGRLNTVAPVRLVSLLRGGTLRGEWPGHAGDDVP